MAKGVKKNYWDSKMEKYAAEFATTNSKLRQEQLYKILLPKLRTMAESILAVYVRNYNYSDQKILIQDAIDDALMELKNHYDPKRTTKLYSFLGTTIKHRLYDLTFLNDKYPRHKFNHSILKLDDFPELLEVIPEVDDNHYQEEQEAILKRFKQLLKEAIADNQPKSRYYTPVERTIKERKIMYMQLCVEYAEKFHIDTLLNLNTYIQNAMGLSDKELELLSIHYFKHSSTPKLNEGRVNNKEYKTNSIIDDDHTPNKSWAMVSLRRRKLRGRDKGHIFY